MVPLYSLLSFLSLLMEQNSVFFDTFRDWCALANLHSGSRVVQARVARARQSGLHSCCTLACELSTRTRIPLKVLVAWRRVAPTARGCGCKAIDTYPFACMFEKEEH